MKIVILASVLLAGPAAAQCTAFLIPPTARVTIDETGKEDRSDEGLGQEG